MRHVRFSPLVLLALTLGATIASAQMPGRPDDPDVPNMKYTFQDAFAEILPQTAPEYFWQKTRSGELEFAVPGWDVTSVDYAVALALHQAPLSPGINLRRISASLGNPSSPFFINKYLRERGDARITRVGRDPKSGRLVGDGIRIEPFKLDASGRRREDG